MLKKRWKPLFSLPVITQKTKQKLLDYPRLSLFLSLPEWSMHVKGDEGIVGLVFFYSRSFIWFWFFNSFVLFTPFGRWFADINMHDDTFSDWFLSVLFQHSLRFGHIVSYVRVIDAIRGSACQAHSFSFLLLLWFEIVIPRLYPALLFSSFLSSRPLSIGSMRGRNVHSQHVQYCYEKT